MLTFELWLSLAATLALVLSIALGLQLVSGVGLYGPKRAERFSRQPWVDVYVFVMFALPWAACWLIAGWWGLLGSFGGQALAGLAWSVMHTHSVNKKDRGTGPIRALGKRVGIVRARLGALMCVSMLPLLVVMRAMQLTLWPVFRRVMGLPGEESKTYFSFTRQQTKGLVGSELVWALFWEWAVCVWSMSGQIVRHAASMFCPMRFVDDAKNRVCEVDFPDVARWGEPNSLAGCGRVIDQMYGGGSAAWFGHSSRAASVAGENRVDEAAKQAA